MLEMTERGRVYEIFSSFQGEGPLIGRRQIFIRFSGCPLHCSYCDTPLARSGVEMTRSHVLERVKSLVTPDLHSISFTGGEPLAQRDFLIALASEMKSEGFRNFLETAGTDADAFASVVDFFDIASIDVKLSVHNAVPREKYDELYRNEIETVGISIDSGVETIVKVVIMRDTPLDEIRRVCDDLSSFDIKFVIQPFFPLRRRAQQAGREAMEEERDGATERAEKSPLVEELFRISEIAGEFLRDVMVIPQMHKMLQID